MLFGTEMKSKDGFTMVELLVVMIVGGIGLWVVYTAFMSQQRSYVVQEGVTEMQQELRASLEIMSREMRNAGHDVPPINDPLLSALPGMIAAGPYNLQFAMDLGDSSPGGGEPNGLTTDPNENVTYQFVTNADDEGGVMDGIADTDVNGAGELGRNSNGGGLQALSSNIHAIGFAYAYDNNSDGKLETNAVTNEIIWAVPDGAGNWVDLDGNNSGAIDVNDSKPATLGVADASQLSQIRGVKIWILARSSRPDPQYTNTKTYKVGANVIGAPNDAYRRRLATATVRCRNMGLQ